ncbi:phosphatase PAP2 family protein [Enterovibrio sp. ZSDZ35]|uniref:undecaprenyl-diphosphate phosphatase n=1 Tax=Enterovibrio qingdaonensis TaxID=2899818 RepID=A0ABT5QI61_9GAMM|nr:phosphatase PAP2 family protein [Enterovibrio sp. ZSDZ35]MDD1780150.1 phosphatase PAP2 family protein [Enterovibrio sp. ZSDZ35]
MNNYKKWGLICSASLFTFAIISSAFFSGVRLTGGVSETLGRVFTYASWSAGKQGFLITTALFCLIPFVLKWPRKKVLTMLMCFGVVLGASFVTKTVVKRLTQEPRPYTQTLAELGKVPSAEAFYQGTPASRDEILSTASHDISPWRMMHWKGETNYSFPSGHTIFAAAAAIFWGAILMVEGYRVLGWLVVGWSGIVAASRMWLGMHWSIDVFASIGFAAIICSAVYASANRLNRMLKRRMDETTL